MNTIVISIINQSHWNSWCLGSPNHPKLDYSSLELKPVVTWGSFFRNLHLTAYIYIHHDSNSSGVTKQSGINNRPKLDWYTWITHHFSVYWHMLPRLVLWIKKIPHLCYLWWLTTTFLSHFGSSRLFDILPFDGSIFIYIYIYVFLMVYLG